jgi:hypothetical protein
MLVRRVHERRSHRGRAQGYRRPQKTVGSFLQGSSRSQEVSHVAKEDASLLGLASNPSEHVFFDPPDLKEDLPERRVRDLGDRSVRRLEEGPEHLPHGTWGVVQGRSLGRFE